MIVDVFERFCLSNDHIFNVEGYENKGHETWFYSKEKDLIACVHNKWLSLENITTPLDITKYGLMKGPQGTFLANLDVFECWEKMEADGFPANIQFFIRWINYEE